MNEQNNPFEKALSTPQSETDPFGTAPELSLGSLPTAENPFDALSETQSTRPGTVVPFSEAAKTDAPEQENESAQFGLDGLQPEKIETADAPANPIEAAMEIQSSTERQSLFAKPPIFEHGAVKEPIEDLDQTFEDLRAAKSDDFPELEDAARVSWSVTYGKIVKTVQTPKKTKIDEFKKQIESSKEFLDALKKDKNKSPDCIIKPRVTAQSKGECASTYKGVFTSLESAEQSGKVICIVPGSDGKVYEIRREESGTYVTPTGECRELSDIRAGFTPALPLIPNHELRKIISFFRSVMQDGKNYEAIANVYWDREREEYHVVVPRQRVSPVRAISTLSDDYDPNRYLHYMDIHSHNVMPAKFSAQDDRDEKATRLYAVIGCLHKFTPEISVRMSNGGKFLEIDPADVFEHFSYYYPEIWNEHITFGLDERPTETNPDNFEGLMSRLIEKGLMSA